MTPITSSPLAQMLQNHPAVLCFSVQPFVFQDDLNVQVGVFQGDVAQVICDAYVAPHMRNRPYFGGTNKAMINRGAERWFHYYARYVEDLDGNQMPFDTFVQREKGSQSLINVVAGESVEKSGALLFKASEEGVFGATLEALTCADRSGFNSILLPPIGAKEMGGLSPRQSAEMIMGAIVVYGTDKMVERPGEIMIGIDSSDRGTENNDWRDPILQNYDVFREVLESKSKLNQMEAIGKKV